MEIAIQCLGEICPVVKFGDLLYAVVRKPRQCRLYRVCTLSDAVSSAEELARCSPASLGIHIESSQPLGGSSLPCSSFTMTAAHFSEPPPLGTWRHVSANITSPSSSISSHVANVTPCTFRLHYVYIPAFAPPSGSSEQRPKGTILLIHGFPETWYEWRHVINPLANAGYRIIVPGYRGNGQAPPSNGRTAGGRGGRYTKIVMADDLHTLVHDVLGITDPVHVVGHDIGAMIAHAYATWFTADTHSLVFVDCPLPGSQFYHDIYSSSPDVWHC